MIKQRKKRLYRSKHRTPAGPMRKCFHCLEVGPLGNDHQCDEINYERGSHWREFKITNSTQIEGDKP